MEYDIEHIKKEMIQLMTGIVNCSHCKKFVEGEELDKQHFPGFIGKKYQGLVFIGKSPGSSKSDNKREIDKGTFNSLLSFKSDPTAQPFEAYQQKLQTAMEKWTVWGKNGGADLTFYKDHGIKLDKIAFINLAKCRFKDPGKKPLADTPACRNKCFELFTNKQLALLAPRYVVFLSMDTEKKFEDVVAKSKKAGKLIPLGGFKQGAYNRGIHYRGKPDKQEENIKDIIAEFVSMCK